MLITDEFERRGFKLPRIPDVIWEELVSFSHTAGNRLRNPIDYSQSIEDTTKVGRAGELLTRWLDFFVPVTPLRRYGILCLIGEAL